MRNETPSILSWKRAQLVSKAGVMATAGIGSVLLVMTLIGVAIFIMSGGVEWNIVYGISAFAAPTTLITALVFSWRFIRKKRRGPVAIRGCIKYGLVGGLTNTIFVSFVVIFFVLIMDGYTYHFATVERLFFSFVLAFLLGVIVGSPVGLIFSLILLRPLQFGCSHRGPHNSIERTASVCGSWLALAGLACTSLVAIVDSYESYARSGDASVLFAFGGGSTVLGLVLYFVARIHHRRRKRWLEKVRQGAVPGWSLIPASDPAEALELGLRPFIEADDEAPMMLLVQTSKGIGPGVYRTGDYSEAVATVTTIK